MKLLISNLFIISIMSACASAPFYDSGTARSVGEGNTSMVAGYQAYSGATVQVLHGVTPDLDIGGQWELGKLFTSIGFVGKYSILNPVDQGLALAIMAGVGSSGSESYYSDVGAGISYKYRFIEPAFFARYNYIINKDEFDYDLMGETHTIPAKNFAYFYLNPALTFWLKPQFAIVLNAGVILPASGVFVDKGSWNYGIGFQFTL